MSKKERYRPLPEVGFVRIHTVLQHIPVARSTWWKWVAESRAPKPIKLDKKITVWRAEEIHSYIKQLSNQQAEV